MITPSYSPNDANILAQTIAQPNRNLVIDIIKIVASFGVVTIHVHNSTQAADNFGSFFLRFCVPFFYITALSYFAASQTRSIDILGGITKIWRRICIPFFTWSFIYTSLLLFKHLLIGGSREFNFWRIFLYGASAEHLYYLPELAVMQILVLGLLLLIVKNKQNVGMGLIVIAICYLAWGSWHNYYGITSWNSVIFYIILSLYIGQKLSYVRRENWYFNSGILLIALSISNSFIKYPALLNNYLFNLPIGGLGLMFIALGISVKRSPQWVLAFSSATYGIYLSHVLLLEAFEFAVERFHYNIYYNLITKLIVTSLIFLISFAFTLIARRYKLTRLLLLGEY